MSNSSIVVRVNTELHPKSKQHPFQDKNGNTHDSIAQAFVQVTEGFVSKLTLGQVIEILARIIYSQFTQHPEAFGGLLRATCGKSFTMKQKNMDFMPGDSMTYCSALDKARTWFINMTDGRKYETSRGTVPVGAQPCLKCGGNGKIAGTGYHLAVCDHNYPGGWKYIGPCFDCLPKGSQEGRGLGYITRSMARSNVNYYRHNQARWEDNHTGIDNLNLWNPDHDQLWHKTEDDVKMNIINAEEFDDMDVPL